MCELGSLESTINSAAMGILSCVLKHVQSKNVVEMVKLCLEMRVEVDIWEARKKQQ